MPPGITWGIHLVKDKRMAIDMLIVRRDIRNNNINLRWVESGHMLADSLTKVQAPVDLLLFVLKNGWYTVVQEKEEKLPEKTKMGQT